ncbi:unnamed protein product [Adineta steineri]|uniref:LTD domain-containing protein n=1 Tax=Adineta steineri TaxID=433720 RepID=A0A818XEF1_9BILA|nr:unnamed protein product [Adineta steineri]CAF3737646.1 unnamed protein product [Adineta steineri]
MAGHIHGNCVKCGKSGGILLCNGCQQTLCFKHVNEHKEELDKQLEDLIHDQDQFQNSLNKQDDSHHLFYEIDQWRKESIEHIKQIAKHAKQDLRLVINQSNEQLLKTCENLKENIHLLKQSEDLSEIQLIKLTNQFNDLKKEINSFQLIKPEVNSIFLKFQKQQINEIVPPPPPPPIIVPPIEKPLPNIEQIHTKQQGSIIISEIDPYGYFIVIEHNGLTTSKDQDMIGWSLKRSIDLYIDMIYKFPNDFTLKHKTSIKILSKQASQTLYLYDIANCLVADSIPTWGTAVKTTTNSIIDVIGDEKDVFVQTFKQIK